jgi:hypothetical protein
MILKMDYYCFEIIYCCIMKNFFLWKSLPLANLSNTINLQIMELLIYYSYKSCFINFTINLLENYLFLFLNFDFIIKKILYF